MELISLTWWQLLIMVIVTLLAGILPTYLNNYFQNKRDREQLLSDKNKTSAENLYMIIKPILKSQILTYHKPYSNQPGTWELLQNLLYGRCDLDSYLQWLLNDKKHYIEADPTNLKDSLKNLILDGLIRKHELEDFIARYAPGCSHQQLTIDTDLLNRDIDFINEQLGYHIPKYSET